MQALMLKSRQGDWQVDEHGHTTYFGVATFFRSHTGVVHYSAVTVDKAGRVTDLGYADGKKVTGGILHSLGELRMMRKVLCPKCNLGELQWVEVDLAPQVAPEGFDFQGWYAGKPSKGQRRKYVSPALRKWLLEHGYGYASLRENYTIGYHDKRREGES